MPSKPFKPHRIFTGNNTHKAVKIFAFVASLLAAHTYRTLGAKADTVGMRWAIPVRAVAPLVRPLNPACAANTVTLTRVPQGGLQPQVVSREGTLHLLYYQGDPNAGDLFYVRSTDEGATWSTPLRVNSQAGSAIALGSIRGGQLALGRDGRPCVLWNGSDTAQPRANGGAPLLFARLDAAGDAFEPQRNLMTEGFDLDGGGSLAADGEGRIYVAWHADIQSHGGEATRLVFLTRSEDDGNTFSPAQPVWDEPTGACGCCQLRLMAETGGRVSLLYRSAQETVHRDVYYLASTDGGRTFHGEKVQDWRIGSCPLSSFSFAQRGTQTLGAWEANAQVHFAALTPDATPARIVTVPPGNNQKYPTLAVNAQGETLLAWTEGTAWARGGKLCWQLYDANGTRIPNTSGERDGVPAWSFPAAFVHADGSFGLLY